MANTITMEFRVTDKGTLKMVGQGATKASKSLDKVSTSSAEADRNTKGVANASSNATKNFSKMAQGMTGTLVPAYATVAANLFALTAAFGALQRAAQVEQLRQGLVAMGQESGIAMETLSQSLREVTGFAISTEEAMRSTAQVISAGFGGEELERIGKVARNASIALGRDLQDSMQRLTRGVIKLEPELLDEIGIMVRLDEATEQYKQKLAIVGRELTLTEKRQAFMNAVLTEGENKFAAVAEKVDPNPFNVLSSSVADLATSFLNIINKAIIPIIELFTELPILLATVAGVFASSIARTILPALATMAEDSKAHADAVAGNISDAFAQAVESEEKHLKTISKVDSKMALPGMKATVAMLEQGFEGTEGQVKLVSSALKGINSQIGRLEKKTANLTEAEKQKLRVLKEQQAAYQGLLQAQTVLSSFEGSAKSISQQRKKIDLANEEARLLSVLDTNSGSYRMQLKTIAATMKGATVAAWNYVAAQFAIANSGNKAKFSLKTLMAVFSAIPAMFTAGASAAKVFGAALLQALPIIGQIIFIGSMLYSVFEGIFGDTKEEKAYKEALEGVNESLKENLANLKEIYSFEKESGNDIVNFYGARATAIQGVITSMKELREAQLATGGIRRTNTGFFGRFKEDTNTATIEKLLRQDEDLAKAFSRQFGTRSASVMVGMGDYAEQVRKAIEFLEQEAVRPGKALKDLQSSLTEGEQMFTRFMQKSTERTPFDEIVGATEAILSNFNDINDISSSELANRGKAFADSTGFFVESVLGLGSALEKFEKIAKSGTEEAIAQQTRELVKSVEAAQARLKASQLLVRTEKELLKTLKLQGGLLKDFIGFEGATQAILDNFDSQARSQMKIQNRAVADAKRMAEANEGDAVAQAGLKEAEAERARIARENTAAREKLVNEILVAELQTQKDILSNEQKVADSRKQQLDSSIQILRNQQELSNLQDPTRADGSLTAKQELDLFEKTKQARIDAAVEQLNFQIKGINLEYDLIEAKYKLLRANLALINAEKGINIQVPELQNIESSLAEARKATIMAAGASTGAFLSNLITEGERLRTAATRVISNPQFLPQLQQARTETSVTGAQNLQGEFAQQFERETQFRQAIIEQQRIQGELEQKLIDYRNAGSDQEAYNLAQEIVLLDQKRQQQAKIVQQATDNLNNVKRIGLQLGESLSSGLEGALNSIAEGTKSVKQAFGDMAISILQDIQKMIIKMLIMKAIQASLSFIPGGAAIGGFLGFAKEGGIMTPEGKVPGYAVGGIAQGPTQGYPAILHGTEAVVPLPNGKSIPVEMRDSATNNVTVNVSVDNQGNAQTSAQMDDQQAGALGRAISMAVQEELQKQKRPGGMLSPYGAA